MEHWHGRGARGNFQLFPASSQLQKQATEDKGSQKSFSILKSMFEDVFFKLRSEKASLKKEYLKVCKNQSFVHLKMRYPYPKL